MVYKLQIIVLSFLFVYAVFGHRGNAKGRAEDNERSLQRRLQEQRDFLDEKFAEMFDTINATLGSQLEYITEVVDSIESRQKFEAFCKDGICGEHGTCDLSEDEETYVCNCEETHAGEHCEITGKCNIDLYHAKQEPMMPGRELPRCDDDGSYAPIQFRGSVAYCVTSDNVELNYSFPKGDIEKVKCDCAREEHANTEEGKTFNCLPNGNYRLLTMKCLALGCWCEDSKGTTVIMGTSRTDPALAECATP